MEVEAWEAAYARFETPAEEIRKFTRRLRALGAAEWPKDARIVELFCGRGNGLVALERLGFSRLVGVDFSPRLIATYRGSAECCVADCRSLPLRDATHQVVIVQGGLHHLQQLPSDLRSVMSEAARVLTPGGLIVVVEPWLTPFLRVVHTVGCSAVARRLSGKMDALATMIEHERETYERWLGEPESIQAVLHERFDPRLVRTQWGKLSFVGRKH